MQVGSLQSVQVGTPQRHKDMKGAWKTSFFRTPDPQPRWLYTTHLEGNLQADPKHHGSLEQAVLLYAAAHYPLWQRELDRPEMGPGSFGENFTVEGLSEETACVGDIYAIGDARIQVTGPRYPCAKIERRWGIKGLTARVAETGRTGWYCRVVQEGMVNPGSPIRLIERPYPKLSIALANDFGHGRTTDARMAQEFATCSLLTIWWRQLIARNAEKTTQVT